ncbi:MAG: sigma-70 family RNA polymerase sigma factor [Phycisphaeraceae bacterium]|nr:MAG: sigma-70 family RNA polymerase sigma factor [Phycisphaeraceae bacterium]
MPRTSADIYDEWLIARHLSGDEGALRDLVGRWHRRLYCHARRLLGEADAADDAAQEAWVAIVRGLGGLNDSARFGPWAYAIVTHKCRDTIRRRARLRGVTPAAGSVVEPPAPSPGERAESIDRLRGAIRGLPPMYRAILALHYLEGMPVAEIAASLGIPPGTVKSRLFHAREHLRVAFTTDESTPHPTLERSHP